MYNDLRPPTPDALHGVMAEYAADSRPHKMDLGVGVYRERNGLSPIMEAVKLAEQRLSESETSKSYLGLQGHEKFLSAMHKLVGLTSSDRVSAIQAVGGTGGIRLALEFAKLVNPNLSIYIGTPTWPNHIAIANELELKVELFEYFDKQSQSVRLENLKSAIASANAGDILIFHGPCHNPTGADLKEAAYWELVQTAEAKGIIALIDVAYYGLGNDLSQDLYRLRKTIDAFSRAFVVMSCSKAFGLYRERTGILFAVTPSSSNARIVQAHLEMLGRKMYSMAPAHGASVVAEILDDETLNEIWSTELDRMRARVVFARSELIRYSRGIEELEHVINQKGIFSLLPISSDQVDWLAKDHAIYMPSSGRINVAGLKDGDAELFCDALSHIAVTA